MDANKTDARKRRWGAVASASVFVLLMVGIIGLILGFGAQSLIIGLILWANHAEPLPPLVLWFFLLMPLAVIVGILIALRQRLKELKGGELDASRDY